MHHVLAAILGVIPYPDLDPIIFHLGPIAVRWYGLAYVAGLFLAYAWLVRMVRRGMLRMPAEEVNNFMLWAGLGVILGARLGWWLFYHRPPAAAAEPWYEPIAIWHGGMSFHGGLIGVAIAVIAFTRRHKIPFWNLADCSALIAPVGLFFGRLANFINAELVGRPTDVPWAMVFPGYQTPRHPSQLYEAILEGPVLLSALWLMKKWLRPPEGTIGASFLVLYGLFRFAVEFTREPDVQLGFIAFHWVTMGQILSATMALVGLALLYRNWTRRSPVGTAR